jgi:hypothetical protein
MTLKQFLKPDWRKIVVFGVIIFIEFLIYYIISISYFPNRLITTEELEELCCESELTEDLINFCLSRNISITKEECERREFTDTYIGIPELIIIITSIFVFLISHYLLSCLIVWIYNKYRGKKK